MNAELDFFELEVLKTKAKARRLNVKLPIKYAKHAYFLAKARNKKEQKFGAMTYGSKLSGLRSHYTGILAEFAVAYYLNEKVDTNIFENSGDDGIDIISDRYGSVGVKSTPYGDDPYLRVEKEHFSNNIHIYILCYVNPDLSALDIQLIGWASKDDVQNAPQQKFKIGQTFGPMNYVLHEHELHDMKDIMCR